jgi:hypothetical protein
MIRVTVELLPLGFAMSKKHLGTAHITNLGTGSPTRGNYKVTLSKSGKPNSIWREGIVRGFKRKQMTAWDLLYLALKACLGERNDD